MDIKNTVKVIPPEFLSDLYSMEGILARSQGYIGASPESGYSQNQKAIIQLPMEFVDLRNSLLTFEAVGSAGSNGTYARFCEPISSIISRITVSFGSKIVYDTQSYGLNQSVQAQRLNENWQTSMGVQGWGYGSTSARNSAFASSQYGFQLYAFHNDLLHSVLPLQKLGVQMIMTIYFNAASACIESDHTTPSTYTVNSLQLHYTSLVPSKNWNVAYDNKVKSSMPPSLSYIAYDLQVDNSVCASGVSNINKTVSMKYSSLQTLFCIFQSGDLNAYATQDKFTAFTYPVITSSYIKIGSIQFPQDNTRTLPDFLSMLCESWSISMQDQPIKCATAFNSTSFIMAFPLNKYPYENNSEENNILGSGIDTSVATNITLNVQFAAPLSGALTLTTIGIYNNLITFNPNGSVTYYN